VFDPFGRSVGRIISVPLSSLVPGFRALEQVSSGFTYLGGSDHTEYTISTNPVTRGVLNYANAASGKSISVNRSVPAQ
jgi:hypothetical protein